MPQINKGKPEDVNMEPVELVNTRISTGYAQQSPRTLGVTYLLMDKNWRLCIESSRRG